MRHPRLYINVDHVATTRGDSPDPMAATAICELAGADGVAAHLCEDRRQIQDDDITRVATSVRTVLDLEMACTDEMLAIGEQRHPHQVTLVPERRQEVISEGGLDIVSPHEQPCASYGRPWTPPEVRPNLRAR